MSSENLRWQLVSSFFQEQFGLNAICCVIFHKTPTAPIERFYKLHMYQCLQYGTCQTTD